MNLVLIVAKFDIEKNQSITMARAVLIEFHLKFWNTDSIGIL